MHVRKIDKGGLWGKAHEWLKRIRDYLKKADFKGAERARKRHKRRMREIENSYWDWK